MPDRPANTRIDVEPDSLPDRYRQVPETPSIRIRVADPDVSVDYDDTELHLPMPEHTDTRHVLETRPHNDAEWTPRQVHIDADEAAEALLAEYSPPARVREVPASDVMGDATEKCGAETANGGRCQHPAGSCPEPSH